MDMIRTISVAAALGLVAGVAPLHAQQGGRHQEDRRQSPAAAPQARPQPEARPQQAQPRPQPQRQVQVQPQPRPEPRPQPQVRVQQPRPQPIQGGQAQVWRQMQQQQPRPVPQQAPVRQAPQPVQRPNAVVFPRQVEQPRQPVERAPFVDQQARIRQEQERGQQYREELNDYTRRLAEQSAVLQQQRRIAAYRFEQRYLANLREQEIRLQDRRADESYYSPYAYRYYRAGTYYEVSQYGAQELQQALNYGYQQGVMAGQADRQDGWGFNYQTSFAYQDANYGYDGLYVNQADYNYYFREGFERGYQDGYNGQFQYGTYSNGNYSMLGALVSSLLGLQLIN